jgi:hypothetical protein
MDFLKKIIKWNVVKNFIENKIKEAENDTD